MGLFAWILFGLIAGLIAKAFHPGKDPAGWFAAIMIGIIGSIIGGWIGTTFGWGSIDGFNFRSMALAIFGGVIFLWIWARLTRRKIHIK